MKHPIESIVLSREEQAALVGRMDAKLATPLTACGRCDACDKQLQDKEMSLSGYATGYPLGLCGKCASFVNTKEAVDAAVAEGHEPKAPAIAYNPQRSRTEAVDEEAG